MSDEPPAKDKSHFRRQVGVKESRKLKAQRKGVQSIWFGFGMFGLIGWSVVVPTLMGAAFGHWLDRHYPEKHSWTLSMLMIGLFVGCLNAWHWISKEEKRMHDDKEDKEDKDE